MPSRFARTASMHGLHALVLPTTAVGPSVLLAHAGRMTAAAAQLELLVTPDSRRQVFCRRSAPPERTLSQDSRVSPPSAH